MDCLFLHYKERKEKIGIEKLNQKFNPNNALEFSVVAFFLRQAQVVNSVNVGDDCHGELRHSEPVELRTINKAPLRNLGLNTNSFS
jgi:hypothetical protein